MIDLEQERIPYILFDLNGQNVAVIEAGIDDTGQLQCKWICVDRVRRFTDQEIEDMLHNAFKDLLRQQAEQDN